MVQAILAGHKSQTRRMKFSGAPGDHIWVRETWRERGSDEPRSLGDIVYRATSTPLFGERWRPSLFMPRRHARIILEVLKVRDQLLQDITAEDAIAEGVARETRTIPGIPYRRPASTETSYKLYGQYEPLNQWTHDARWSFQTLWQSIHGPESWDANPSLRVVEFRVLEARP